MRHYFSMSGEHGCMPDYHSGACETKIDAARAIANVFDKSDSWARKFATSMYHDFKPGEGASYAEIAECDCSDPTEHCEYGCGCSFCDAKEDALKDAGFDRGSCGCSGCEAVSINGMACHETGCPVARQYRNEQ